MTERNPRHTAERRRGRLFPLSWPAVRSVSHKDGLKLVIAVFYDLGVSYQGVLGLEQVKLDPDRLVDSLCHLDRVRGVVDQNLRIHSGFGDVDRIEVDQCREVLGISKERTVR